ncbi:MAG: adenylate/guanylate cyclase domain-containing protein [Xanthobacteraceae bacterium]
MACIGCGFELSPDFAFCPRCGRRRADAPAAAPAPIAAEPDADRRQVTVLFADVTGFTTLSERLDPEDVRAYQNALFEALAQAIARYDGFVEKFVGDAVLAVFGAPIAHEDDPERALHAALDMLARSAVLSEQWAQRLGQPVTLHIGVHTGPVVAGSLGSAAGAAYAVTGDTVNTTARLLAAASGAVLVSDATYALTSHRFAFDPPRELALRGKSEPVVVHSLVGALAEPGSARGLSAHGLATPLIGRADELEQLRALFDEMDHRAQVVSLVGEAGVGKSRVIAEFLARLDADGSLSRITLRRISCSSLGEPTYGVFSALFREAYHVAATDTLDVARQKLESGLRTLGADAREAETMAPLLSYVLGMEEARLREVEPEQLRRQIALAARALLERRLHHSPLLIVIEDLHWADAASIELLRYVVDQLVDRPLMLLLSHRADAAPPKVLQAAQTIIRLTALTPDQTRALVGSLFGAAAGDMLPHLQDFVATKAGGNPLFVEEIIRSLVGKGVLVRDGEHWACTTTCEAVDIPPTLHGLLLSRVDRLSADTRRLLQEGAVLGAAFDEALLRGVATHADGIAQGLDRLVEADLLRRPDHGGACGRYEFTHALVHEAVYQNLLLTRRTELHERAGRALERAVGPHPQRLGDIEALGHHWSLSSDQLKGARYLIAGGDWARAVYANEDAIRHYERALRTLADCRDCRDQVQAARERLADLFALTGRRNEALAHYEAVRQECEAASDFAGAARLYRKVGGLHWEAGDRKRAGGCFEAGLERLGHNGHAVERAQLFQEIGRLAFRDGDNAGAIAWAERALAEAGEGGDVADTERARDIAVTRAQAYNTLGVALARTGRLGEAVTHIERSISLAEARELLQAACRGYTNLGVLYSSLDPPRSIETCLRGLETAKKVGDLGFQSRLYANLAVAYCALTDRCEAEGMEAAQVAADLDRRLGLLDHLAVPLIVLGQIHQCHGDHAQALASYQEALGLAEQIGEPQLLFPCYDGLATLYLDAGDHARAEIYLAKSQEVCARAGIEPDALMVLPFLT